MSQNIDFEITKHFHIVTSNNLVEKYPLKYDASPKHVTINNTKRTF